MEKTEGQDHTVRIHYDNLRQQKIHRDSVQRLRTSIRTTRVHKPSSEEPNSFFNSDSAELEFPPHESYEEQLECRLCKGELLPPDFFKGRTSNSIWMLTS